MTTESSEVTEKPIDWEAMLRERDRLEAELDPANKSALFDALARAGVTFVAVTFDGCSDSGQIENIEAKSGDDVVELPSDTIEIADVYWDTRAYEIRRSRLSLADALESLAYHYLGQSNFGWEDNEGAYGDFTFDVVNRAITLDFNQRFMDSENTKHVF